MIQKYSFRENPIEILEFGEDSFILLKINEPKKKKQDEDVLEEMKSLVNLKEEDISKIVEKDSIYTYDLLLQYICLIKPKCINDDIGELNKLFDDLDKIASGNIMKN